MASLILHGRTHRERKEQYTKDLEIEVMRLKELFTQATRERDGAIQSRDAALVERDQLLEENQRMREYIQPSNSSSGRDSGYDSMSWTCDSGSSHSDTSGPNLTANAPLQEVADSHIALRRASTRDMAETRGFAFDVPPSDSYTIKVEDTMQRDHSNSAMTAQLPTELPAPPLDYDALGLDFVLTLVLSFNNHNRNIHHISKKAKLSLSSRLERPCMGHIQYLHIRAYNNNNPPPPPPSSSLPSSTTTTTLSPHLPTPTPPEDVPNDNENLHISGHALMATAPSYTSIMQHHQHQQQQHQHPTSKTPPPPPYTPQFPPFTHQKDLIHLLNLSANLEICEQEVPPVRAWVKLMQDQRVREAFGWEELEEVKEWLVGKVCCYRYVWTLFFFFSFFWGFGAGRKSQCQSIDRKNLNLTIPDLTHFLLFSLLLADSAL